MNLRSHKLVCPFIGDHREGRWIVEHVVMAVDLPESLRVVAQVMIAVLGEIRESNNKQNLHIGSVSNLQTGQSRLRMIIRCSST